MSTRRSARGALAACVTVSTVLVLGGASTAVASADPPGVDPPSCSSALDRAAAWPGVMSASGHDVHLVSDGFDSYLRRQAPCTTAV
jgi:hypothetical protein